MREAAHQYLNIGFSVFPCGADKRPLIKWTKYQTERATHGEIETWFKQMPDMNIGIATGALSGIAVVDVEAGGDIERFPPTVMAKTQGQGWHLYYKYPSDEIRNSTRITDLTDVRGIGGFVVAPPSIGAKGSYEWIRAPWDFEMAEYPAEVMNALVKTKASVLLNSNNTKGWRELIKEDVIEGERNNMATKIAGGLLNHYPMEQWENKAWPAYQKWCLYHCKPPMPDDEARRTFDSIRQAEETGRAEQSDSEAKNQADVLIDMVTTNPDIELFRDEYDIAFVKMNSKDQKETWNCRSRKFSLWLLYSYRETFGFAPQPSAISLAVQALEGKAIFKGKQYKLHNRVANADGATWYDLADKQNRVIRITPDGWSIVSDPPILFRRHKHQLEQVEPVTGGAVSDFLPLVNVTGRLNQLLLQVYLVSCFIPEFPHPILYLFGQKGSAKSTLSKLLRNLVDPSKIEVLIMPSDTKELVLHLARHHLVFYDNVSRISDKQSDLFCVAVTGGGISKRELYTDADDFIFHIQTNVGINGINVSAIQPDLLERSILMELTPVGEDQRLTEHVLYAEFEKIRPKILGAIFEAVSKALKIVPSIQLAEKTRMADFLVWGCAIAEALGYKQSEFIEAYHQKIQEQIEVSIAASLVAQTLIKFIEDINSWDEKPFWEGTPTELIGLLRKVAENQNNGRVPKYFPEEPNQLTRQINILKPNLLTIGISISDGKSGTRYIRIEKITKNIDQTVQSDHLNHLDDEDDKDDVS